MACHAEQEIELRKEYQLAKPRETIFSSLAPKNRLIKTLEKYRALLNEKKADVKLKKEIEDILNDVKESDEDFQGCSHTSRLIHNMTRLEKLLNNYPEHEEDLHMKAHKRFDGEPFELKKGKFDEEHVNEMAKPRKVQLKNTLESYRNLMSSEKQKRLENELGKIAISPENLEEMMRKSPEEKLKNDRDDAIKLLRQIESKIAGDVFDEITEKLQKKLPKMILNRRDPMMMTQNFQRLHNFAHNIIVSINGPPKDENDEEQYRSFAGIIGDFVVKTLADSMGTGTKKHTKNVKKLKAVEMNQDLLNIAQNLMEKIH